MVAVAQLVRASGCGPEGRRFEPGQSPHILYLRKASAYGPSFTARLSRLSMKLVFLFAATCLKQPTMARFFYSFQGHRRQIAVE